MRLTRCCCCLTLRQGTYVCAVYAMIMSVIGVSLSAYIIHYTNETAVIETVNEAKADNGDTTDASEGVGFLVKLIKVVLWITLVLYLLWFITAITIFPAVLMGGPCFLKPFEIVTYIMIAIEAFNLGSSMWKLGEIFSSSSTAFQFMLQIVQLMINTYVVLCVSSFYKQSMEGPEQIHDEDLEMCPAVSPLVTTINPTAPSIGCSNGVTPMQRQPSEYSKDHQGLAEQNTSQDPPEYDVTAAAGPLQNSNTNQQDSSHQDLSSPEAATANPSVKQRKPKQFPEQYSQLYPYDSFSPVYGPPDTIDISSDDLFYFLISDTSDGNRGNHY